MLKKQLPLDNSGNLLRFSFPGGYEIHYITQDGCILCANCANKHRHLSGDEHDPQWNVIGYDTHWEGLPISCDHCNKEIESEYGEVE